MRHLTTCLVTLALCPLALTGCVGDMTDLDDPAGESEAIAQTSAALTTPQITSYPATALEATNGKKIVYAGGTFHAVYATGGAIKYTSSSDGITWGGLATIDSGNNAASPTIAVAADGTVVVAFVRYAVSGTGNIFYNRRPAGSSSFSGSGAATQNNDYQGGRTPSLMADGNTFHLTWARPADVRYTSMASLAGTPASSELVFSGSQVVPYFPAMLAGPGQSGTRVARVSVYVDNPAWHYLEIRTLERSLPWSTVDLTVFPYTTSGQPVAVSTDINPATGDTMIAHSHVVDGVGKTSLIRENAVTLGFSFARYDLSTSTAQLISVATRNEYCASRFRIITSTPSGSHGSAAYRTGSWISGAAPAWVEPAPVGVTGTDRAGTALMHTQPISGSLNSRFYTGTFEEANLGSYRLVNSYEVFQTPVPCE